MRTIEKEYNFGMTGDDMIKLINNIKEEGGTEIYIEPNLEYGYYDDVSPLITVSYKEGKK